MATVTGFTAAKMQEIADECIVDGNVVSGDLILTRRDLSTINAGNVVGPGGIAIVTSSTRPGSPTTGMSIYETDTKRFYIYNGTTWVYTGAGSSWVCTSSTRPASPFAGLQIYETDTKKVYIYDGAEWDALDPILPKGFGSKMGSALFTVTSTTGVDWNSAAPLDVTFTKKGGATETNIHVKVYWSGYHTGAGLLATFGGVKIDGTSVFPTTHHSANTASNHQEWSDFIVLTGTAAGSRTMRAIIKKTSGSQTYTADTDDYFRIEYQEVPV